MTDTETAPEPIDDTPHAPDDAAIDAVDADDDTAAGEGAELGADPTIDF